MPINITPYKEVKMGHLSIYDFVEDGYVVPDKVIVYLKTKKPYIMSPGMYPHPFKKEMILLGPYLYTDGIYCWDRDTWKYVVKYHLTLPQEFVEHVMSEAGTEFLRTCFYGEDSFYNTIEKCYRQTPHHNFLPKDAGDVVLKEF